ncbi:hypothetical protein [Necropsobacter massiliensis]|uniref:hypothetical protein n=1 Tax=Necropsobacter massiliensis TaxID=1400001 RepID=UPI00059589D6|nr:hypothetical protein [Necropsobacter massiliensis]
MPINFTQIFQDSWNFMRNQQKITLQFSAFFFVVAFAVNLLVSNLVPANMTIYAPSADTADLTVVGNLMLSKEVILLGVVQVLLNLFISCWGMMTFHQLSERHQLPLSHTLSMTATRFIGVFFINLIIVLPMVIGLAESLLALASKQSPSLVSVFAITLGIFIFIRLNLATVHYLITRSSLAQTLKTIWLSGFKRTGVLFIYCLLIYFALPLVVRNIAALSDNMLFDIVISFIISALNVFSLIFTYRFYTLFMQKVRA